jgi:hypothetical protein
MHSYSEIYKLSLYLKRSPIGGSLKFIIPRASNRENTVIKIGFEIEMAIGPLNCYFGSNGQFKNISKILQMIFNPNCQQQNDSASSPDSVDDGSEGLNAIFRWWFNLLHFGGELQKRLEPAEYFSQPFVAQHFDWYILEISKNTNFEFENS